MCSYESIKSSIRLLLTSASNGLTLDQLNADYQYYNQSKDIPYTNFGYKTLFDFLYDMSDIVQFDLNAPYPIVYSVRARQTSKRQLLSIGSNRKQTISTIKTTKKPLNKNIKRLALNCLTDSTRQSNISTEHIVRQLTSLTMNPKYSENFSSNEILTISINSNDQCQIVRYVNGKYFIPCFELSRILNLNENLIDKETMFSRIRIYQSNDLFHQFQTMKISCLHSQHLHRPYFFLFLISSILPLLKLNKNINQFYQIIQAFEQLINL